MDTISLYYFTEAAKDLNFTQTVNRLFLSQQNLTYQIAKLESHCGCKLFERKPKLRLTYEGELFLAYAQEAVASENDILSVLRSVSDENSGRLRIGVSTPRASAFIPEILKDFSPAYPHVAIQLLDHPSYQLERLLANNAMDFCVGVFQTQNPELRATHLLSDQLYLCMSDSLFREYAAGQTAGGPGSGPREVSLADFPGLPVALPSDKIPLYRVILSCYEEAGATPHILLTTAYPQMFRALYYQGTAAFFATGMILSDHRRNRPAGVSPLRAFPMSLHGEPVKREITLLSNRQRSLSKPAQHFVHLTQEFYKIMEREQEAISQRNAL